MSKGCPFCNNHKVKVCIDARVRKWQVVCTVCGAEGPLSIHGPQGARELWEWRQADKQIKELQEQLDQALKLVGRLRDKNNKMHIELHGSLIPEDKQP